MSTTSLVRSSSGHLTSSSPSTSSPKPATPSAKLPAVLPKLNLTPRSSTPPTQTPTPQPSTPGTSTPGQWQHPRMKEVMQRQSRTNFDKRNVWGVGINVAAMLLSIAAPALLYSLLPSSTIRSLRPYDTYTLFTLRVFILANIAYYLAPLLRQPDNMEDIPLTPAQRQLLGLPPMSRPATPAEKEQWITPPRYTRSRSGTPQSPASSLRAQASGSPGSGSMFGSGTPQRESSGSPYGSQQHSPSSLTPLRSGIENRRLSYNTRGSPLGNNSDFDATLGSMADTSSTSSRKGPRASVGLNSKWLYEKGLGAGGKGSPSRRGSSGSGGPDFKGWGTGSVFN